jgi:IS4 transposase
MILSNENYLFRGSCLKKTTNENNYDKFCEIYRRFVLIENEKNDKFGLINDKFDQIYRRLEAIENELKSLKLKN